MDDCSLSLSLASHLLIAPLGVDCKFAVLNNKKLKKNLAYRVSVFGKLILGGVQTNFISLTCACFQIAMGTAHEHRSNAGTNESRRALLF